MLKRMDIAEEKVTKDKGRFMMKYNQLISQFMIEAVEATNVSICNLHKILTDNGIRYCIIGGVGLRHLKIFRMTEDVDILVHIDDKSKMENLPIDLIRKKSVVNYILHIPPTLIDVLYSSTKTGEGEAVVFEDPTKICDYVKLKNVSNIPFLKLEKMIEYKISSGLYSYSDREYKDFGDVQELIKIHKLPKEYGKEHFKREDIIKKYEEIYNKSIK